MPLLPLLIGLTLFASGALVVWVNVYTSFIRYPLHRWRGGTREDFRWVSGVPLVGSFLLLFAAVALSGEGGHRGLMWAALVVSLLDTGGPIWGIGWMLFLLLRTLLGRPTGGT